MTRSLCPPTYADSCKGDVHADLYRIEVKSALERIGEVGTYWLSQPDAQVQREDSSRQRELFEHRIDVHQTVGEV